jgi:hypothetical protein
MAVSSWIERRGTRAAARLTLAVVLLAVGLCATASSAPQGVRAAAAVPAAWTTPVAIPSAKTYGTPALVAYDGVLVAAWQGKPSPYHVYYSGFNGTKWSPYKAVPSAGGNPDIGPALGVYNGDLYVAWEESDNQISYASYNGTTWTSPASIPSALTKQTPALGAYDGRLYLAWTGQSQGKVWFSRFNGATWSTPAVIPTAVTYPQDAITALAAYDNKLYASWGGPGDKIGYASFNGKKWSTPNTFASEWYNGPALAVDGGLLYDAWTDYNSGAPYYADFNGSTWTAETPISTGFTLESPGLAAYNGSLFAAWVAYPSDVVDYSSGP